MTNQAQKIAAFKEALSQTETRIAQGERGEFSGTCVRGGKHVDMFSLQKHANFLRYALRQMGA